MAETIKGYIYDGVKGAKVQFGTFTLDPSSINADTQGTETVEITNAAVGDLIFVNPRSCTAGLAVQGAHVSDAGEVTITLQNTTEAAVNGAELTYDYVLIKLA